MLGIFVNEGRDGLEAEGVDTIENRGKGSLTKLLIFRHYNIFAVLSLVKATSIKITKGL